MLNIFKKKESSSKEIKCELCGMEFVDKGRFVKHKEKAHPKGR